ncbi:hypothetical protein [Demequina globuliformis]|uniref:hypothetical protein n=1 Tax=Demequina globuliformis TaxID=676202 RepID=UPI000785DFF7|nr:hypothetical protein [Demequina globuliformis]
MKHSSPRPQPALTRWRDAARRHRAQLRSESQSDRGDVPGWVLITLMSAGLVAVIWAVAETQLTTLFGDAIKSVTGG